MSIAQEGMYERSRSAYTATVGATQMEAHSLAVLIEEQAPTVRCEVLRGVGCWFVRVYYHPALYCNIHDAEGWESVREWVTYLAALPTLEAA